VKTTVNKTTIWFGLNSPEPGTVWGRAAYTFEVRTVKL